ncbi:MAG: hypothetical protein ACJ79E_07420 [Anaeromyxobacteraceae bacterium]
MPGDERRDVGGNGNDSARTDLEPKRLPYDDDYFGTGEEEGVVKERDASHAEQGGEAAGREPSTTPQR